MINNGLPHSLITVAQRTVTSVAVTIAQPVVALVALIAARCALPDERITLRRLVPQCLALAGTVLTSAPAFGGSAEFPIATQIFNHSLLAIAVVSFGVGSVFLKWAFPAADGLLVCAGELAGSAVYGVIFCMVRLHPQFLIVAFKNIDRHTIAWSVVIGFFYTFSPGLLWIYVIRELGPVKANFANFGQIVIGVLAGVLFLGEWGGYSRADVGISLLGLVFLTVSIFVGFLLQDKPDRHREYGEPQSLV